MLQQRQCLNGSDKKLNSVLADTNVLMAAHNERRNDTGDIRGTDMDSRRYYSTDTPRTLTTRYSS